MMRAVVFSLTAVVIAIAVTAGLLVSGIPIEKSIGWILGVGGVVLAASPLMAIKG